MILSTNKVTHELILNNRNVVRMLDMLGTDDLSAAMLDGMNHVNTKKLATAIYALDRSNFKSIDEVYDFLDDYKAEHECTVREIYADLIREFNDHYFFDRKMTEKELTEWMNNPLAGRMDDILAEAAGKAIGSMAEEQFAARGM